MEHRDVFVLESIIDFCEKIEECLRDDTSSKEEFLSKPKVQDLCAFYCLQIGEYAGSLSNNFREAHQEIAWREIIALRHKIAHSYGTIDASTLWNICTEDIPALCDFCKKQIK